MTPTSSALQLLMLMALRELALGNEDTTFKLYLSNLVKLIDDTDYLDEQK